MTKKIKVSIFLVGFGLIVVEPAMAKDVVQALRQTESKAREIFMALGPISLILSAAAFQVSKQMGMTLLIGALIGIAVFAGRNGIFGMLVNIFS